MYDKENVVGSKVSVYLKGTYGLENDIEENLVFDKEIFSKLDNFKLIKEELLEVSMRPERLKNFLSIDELRNWKL
jgi:hypothetical protein